MSKIDRLLAKGKKITFQTDDGDVSFLIRPLKNKEILEIVDLMENKKEMAKAMNLMVYYSIKKDDPDITLEQVEEMPFLNDFINVIMEVNHLEIKKDFQRGEEGSSQEKSSPTGRVDLRKIQS